MATTSIGSTGVTFPDASLQATSGVTLVNGKGPGVVQSVLVSGTAVAATSGTSIDYTGIPSWAKCISIIFYNVSTTGASPVQIQIGSGAFVTTGYSSIASGFSGGGATTLGFSSGIVTGDSGASNFQRFGVIRLALVGSNLWSATGQLALPAIGQHVFAGGLGLSGALDRVRITTINGTDTFDSGSVNIIYE